MLIYPKLGPWTKGMNTLKRAETLEDEEARNIVNFDVDDAGKVQLRQGRTKVYAGNIVKDTFWSEGDISLFVEDGDLKILNTDFTATLLRSGVGYSPMRYVLVNGLVYYTNGVVTGIVREGSSESWGVKAPSQQPALSAANSSGSLSAGYYQVAVTFISPTGEESGTGLSAEVQVEEGDSIDVSAIPQPPAGHTMRLYVSAANGEKLHSLASLIPGQVSYRITQVANQTGRVLETQFGDAPPAGNLLEYHDGRIYIGAGNIVWVTEPLRYGLVKRTKGFFMFGGQAVTMIKSVQDGIYIAADKTYFLTGIDTPEMENRDVLPYGSIDCQPIEVERTTEGVIRVAWWSERGICVGARGGAVTNIMEDKVAVSKFKRGALLFREHDGIRQIIACLQDGTQSTYAVSDYVVDETARRGNAI